MNKQLQTTLLITEQTLRELGDDFAVAAKPPVAAKGKSKPVQVYEVVSGRPSLAKAA
jgi:class 3 adenylate cyclase